MIYFKYSISKVTQHSALCWIIEFILSSFDQLHAIEILEIHLAQVMLNDGVW